MDAVEGDSGVLANLKESLCRDEDIEFAVAFGSQGAGDAGSSSDIDIAVKFDGELSTHERFRKRCFLSGDLQRSDGPFIDLSDLDTLPVEFAHEAVTGKLLCGDDHAFRRTKADIQRAFEARREDIDRHHQSVIDRIAKQGLHG